MPVKSNAYRLILLLVVAQALVGCAVRPTPQVSPLRSPLTAASPVETPTGPLISPTLDLANVALRPADMESLFKTTYFVSQPYTRSAMSGLLVTFPTRIAEHESAFEEGFSTRVEIYSNFDEAVKEFRAAVAAQNGQPFSMANVGSVTRAFQLSGEVNTYTVVVRQVNALVIITIKTPQKVTAETMERLIRSVVQRLGS